jgi:ureidoglycolate lyase
MQTSVTARQATRLWIVPIRHAILSNWEPACAGSGSEVRSVTVHTQSNLVNVRAERLTSAGFRAFGTPLGLIDRAHPDVIGSTFVAWYPLGEVDEAAPLRFGLVEAQAADGPLTVMEVHSRRSECAFAPDEPFVLAVAHSTPDGLSPDAETARAFVLAPGEGAILPPGIWHAAGAPVGAGPVKYLFALARPLAAEVDRGWVPFADGIGVVVDASNL